MATTCSCAIARKQFLLLLDPDVLEHVRRERRWQDAKDDHLLVFGQIENDFRHIGRRPFAKHFAQRAEIAGVDHALDFWCENVADHVGVFNTRALLVQREAEDVKELRVAKC